MTSNVSSHKTAPKFSLKSGVALLSAAAFAGVFAVAIAIGGAPAFAQNSDKSGSMMDSGMKNDAKGMKDGMKGDAKGMTDDAKGMKDDMKGGMKKDGM